MSSAGVPGAPGEILHGEGSLVLNAGRPATELEVANTGDRAVQVGSHFHFFEVNRALHFDRVRAYGLRLDIPSGTSVRFEAGQTHRVTLVPFGGERRVVGFNGFVQDDGFEEAAARARAAGFDIPGTAS